MIPQRTRAEPDAAQAVIKRGIGALLSCAQACHACVDACLREDAVRTLRHCIRLNLDCADVCSATAALNSRAMGANDEVTLRLLDVCATAAERCAEECERHADHHEHCARCAEQCRRAEELCRLTMQELGGASGLVQTN